MSNLPEGTYKILASKLPELRHRIEILNRRVRKTGGSGLSLEVDREENETVASDDPDDIGLPGGKRVRRVAFVRIDGEVPKLAGWAFVARVEHHDELGNIVSKAPRAEGIELPDYFRTAGATCDHCQTNRRRNDTFVLQDGTGAFCRVGRNCLQDFLRGTDPGAALKIWALLDAIRGMLGLASEEYEDGCGGSGELSTTWFLACTASAIRHHGWTSKKAAQEDHTGRKQPTAEHAAFLAGPPPNGRSRQLWTDERPTDADIEEAGEIVAWAATLADRAETSDYLQNLRVAVSLGYVSGRHMGIVASAVAAYRREIDRALEQAKRAAAGPGEYFGEVKKRYTFDRLTVTFVRYCESAYGVTTLLGLEDAAGHAFKWFASGSHDYKAGQTVTGKGTVKSHGAYQGRNETVLSRCAFELVQVDDEQNAA